MTSAFTHEFDTAADILDAWGDAIEQSPKTARVFVEGTVRQSVEDDIQNILIPQLYQNPVKYKIDWETPKQQRFYFGFVAKRDSDGEIIPYKRTFGLARDWTVTASGDPLTITVSHPSAIAKYVIGKRQQRFHKATGHPRADLIILEIFVKAEDTIIDGWFSIIDFKGTLL